jgi:hypothetical protein
MGTRLKKKEALSQYKVLVLVESRAIFQRIRGYLTKRQVDLQQVAFVCIPDDVFLCIEAEWPSLHVFSVRQIIRTGEAVTEASRLISRIESKLQDGAEKSPFLWTIFEVFHSDYLIHREACFRLASDLVDCTSEAQEWILAPDGYVYGHVQAFAGSNPVMFLVFEERLRNEQRRYRIVRPLMNSPSVIYIAQALAVVVNWLGLITASFLGYCFGFLQPKRPADKNSSASSAPKVLGLFEADIYAREHTGLFTGSSVKADVTSLKLTQLGLTNQFAQAEHRQNVFWGCINLGLNILKWLKKEDACYKVAQLDHRMKFASLRWFFFYLLPGPALNPVKLILRSREIRRDMRAALAIVRRIFAEDSDSRSLLDDRFTVLLFCSYFIQYLYAEQFANYILKRERPDFVVYPDGYSMLIRMFQWMAKSGRFKGVQVPHGTPNRHLPRHLFSADLFLAPSTMTVNHLTAYGISSEKIKRCAHPYVGRFITIQGAEMLIQLQEFRRKLESRSLKTIYILYTGTHRLWSFPGCFSKLYPLSVDLIVSIQEIIPEVQIVLKSHPNGTSSEFFSALQYRFLESYKTGKIVHRARISTEIEKDSVGLVFSLITFAATPFNEFLTRGIPNVLIREDDERDWDLSWYPSPINFRRYPLELSDSKDLKLMLGKLLGGAPWPILDS